MAARSTLGSFFPLALKGYWLQGFQSLPGLVGFEEIWDDFEKRNGKHPDCRPNAATDSTHRTRTPLDGVLRMVE